MSDSLHDRRWPDQTAEFLANEATRTASVAAARGVDESAASEPTSPRFGRYLLLEQLGSNTMGEVYRALHARLHKQVTLKRLPPERASDAEARARFEREVRLISRLAHPNIVRLENAGEHDGQPFMVMEHVDGIDLETLIARVGPLRSEDACQLAGQAALGLAHLAEHGFVLRDIRPSSLILSSSGALKIADFSAAQSAEDDCDFPIGMKALGRTLLALLSGNSSSDGFEADGFSERCDQPLPRLADSSNDVPDGLQRVLDRMTVRDTDQRISLPHEAAKALAPFAVGCDLTELLRQADLTPPHEYGPAASRVHSAEYLTSLAKSGIENEPVRRTWAVCLAVAVIAVAVTAPIVMYLTRVADESLRPAMADATSMSTTGVPAASRVNPAPVAVEWDSPAPIIKEPIDAAAAEVDLARQLDPHRDAINVQLTPSPDGPIVSNAAGRGMAQVPLIAFEDYELVATVERMEGDDSFGIGFSAGDARLLALVDHKHDDRWSSGLAYFDSRGDLNFVQSHEGRLLPAGKPIQLRIRVGQGKATFEIADPLGPATRVANEGSGSSVVSEPVWLASTWTSEPFRPSLGTFDSCYPHAPFLHVYKSGFRVRELIASTNAGPINPQAIAALDSPTDRQLAELVLWRGGEVEVRDADELDEDPSTETALIEGQQFDDLPSNLTLVGVDARAGGSKFDFRDEHLARLAECRSLTRLDLRGTDITNQGLASLAGMPALEFLAISGSELDGSGLNNLGDLPALRRLMFNRVSISDDDLSLLQRYPELTVVCLSQCPIGDRGVAAVAPTLTKLEHLCLNSTKINGDCLSSLAPLQSLRELQFAGTQVTDDKLSVVAELPKLKKLQMTKTPISDVAVWVLKATHPELEIKR